MAGRANFPPTRRGYDVREVVSALQKAIRQSDTHQALYWTYELDRSGYGNWAWKRLVVICSEDVGPGSTGLAGDIRALRENWREARKINKQDPHTGEAGEEILYITHAVIALCNAPKSRVVDWAVWHHNNDHVERLEIPDEAYDKHTLKGRRLGRGALHFLEEATRLVHPADAAMAPGQKRPAIPGDPEQRLAALEDAYEAAAERFIKKDPTQPVNPWIRQVVHPGPGETSPDDGPVTHRLPGMN